MAIPIIDLFAGPGGLGEGFSSIKDDEGLPFFEIALSIEKDPAAHKTLTLRSFYRQFQRNGQPVPQEYYEAIQEADIRIREQNIQDLFQKFPEESAQAKQESQLVTLGAKEFPPEYVDELITNAIDTDEPWLLIGGPPCQAYSLVGRSRNGGIDDADHRVHLYKEYLRIIAVHKPTAFVMENVKGLLSAKLEKDDEPIFEKMKRDLCYPRNAFPGADAIQYSINSLVKKNVAKNRDYLIKSENYGLPQKRHRVILLGVREDIGYQNPQTLELQNSTSLKEVIGDLPTIRSAFSKKFESADFIEGKLKRHYSPISDTPDYWLEITNGFRDEIIKWGVLPEKRPFEKINLPEFDKGAEFIEYDTLNNSLDGWYSDDSMVGVLNHETRSHLYQDIRRYLFSSIYTQIYRRFPRLNNFEKISTELIPEHQNHSTGKFNDRFRVQLDNEPATTVTSHISKDGHYFIHYDPQQCRSFTVREAARVQTFPDNYLFRGSRTQQFHQVGNAVPPYLAYQIATIVKSIF